MNSKPKTTILALLPAYATGFFSLSLQQMMLIVIPLWTFHLGLSPIQIGFIVAAGAILPTLFSISSGALIDRVGSKRVILLGGLFMAPLILMPPTLPFVGLIFMSQFIFGQLHSMTWMAAQTYMMKTEKRTGEKVHSGRFSFASNAGVLVGPLLVGIIWDLISPLAAFIFIAMWGLCLSVSGLFLKEQTRGFTSGREDRGSQGAVKMGLKGLIPVNTYVRSFKLLINPLIVLVIYCTFIRLSGFSIIGSFYPVYLTEIGMLATWVSILVSVISLMGIVSSLCSHLILKWMSTEKALFLAVLLFIPALTLTPLFENIFVLGFLAVVAGFGLGLTLPYLLSLLSEQVSLEDQGLSVGLRNTFNRLAAVVVPVIFGFVVDRSGLTAGFYILGAILLIPFVLFFIYSTSKVQKRNQQKNVV